MREYSLQFASTTSKTGTSLNWAAPEVLEEKTKLTIEADVYSLGMVRPKLLLGQYHMPV